MIPVVLAIGDQKEATIRSLVNLVTKLLIVASFIIRDTVNAVGHQTMLRGNLANYQYLTEY